jgi:hypothetical protein
MASGTSVSEWMLSIGRDLTRSAIAHRTVSHSARREQRALVRPNAGTRARDTGRFEPGGALVAGNPELLAGSNFGTAWRREVADSAA